MSDIIHRDGNCIRCGQFGTLTGLADIVLTLEAGATPRNHHVPHGASHLSIGICETCTWAIAGSWPSAVGMCAAIRNTERRIALRDRRAGYAAQAAGRRASDKVILDPRPSPAGESR